MFSTSRHEQSGNIMIYILGAIVLIGILVIMVKGSTTPGAGIDNETLQLKVAEVQQYGMELERAVTYILRDGYSESDIRFAHPNHSSAYGDITDDPGRQVFARAGGGATWQDNDVRIQTIDTDWNFNGSTLVVELGSSSSGARSSDLTAWLPYVNRDFCIAINDSLGIDNPSGNPPRDINSINITHTYAGSFDGAIQVNNINFRGKKEGCMESDVSPPSGTYHYYRVLLAR